MIRLETIWYQLLGVYNMYIIVHIYIYQESQRGGVWSLSEWIMGTLNLHGSHPFVTADIYLL